MQPPPPVPLRTGRPRDEELTRRLLAGALALVAARGIRRLNAESLAEATGAGKAAIYRRWPSMSLLLVDAVDGVQLIGPAPDTGSLRGDLLALLESWNRPPSEHEHVAAALLGQAHHDEDLRRCLHRVVVDPLDRVVTTICDREAARGTPVPAAAHRLLRRVLQALWWERGSTAPDPLDRSEMAGLVDRVLLPVVQSP